MILIHNKSFSDLIPAPRNNQLQMLRRISNLENVGTFNPTGKPHDYEEIGKFRNTVRGSGDGQPKDNLEAYIKSPVDPKHTARIKPGSSGQGPFSPIVVKDINIDGKKNRHAWRGSQGTVFGARVHISDDSPTDGPTYLHERLDNFVNKSWDNFRDSKVGKFSGFKVEAIFVI